MQRRETKYLSLDMALCGAFIATAMLFGGASREGFIAHALVQIAAFALIAFVIVRRKGDGIALGEARLDWLVAALVGLQLIQLIPLPYAFWSSLPGREVVAEGFRISGVGQIWLPISLNPEGTLQTMLAIVPALAVLLFLQYRERTAAVGGVAAVMAVAAASALLGVAQLVSGSASFTYLYKSTNHGSGVAFFANSNHLATLMVASVPLAIGAAAWLRIHDRSFRKRPLPFLLLGGLLPLAVLGTLASGSLAGVGLMGLVFLGCIPIVFGGLRGRTRWLVAAGLLLLLAVAIGVVLFSPMLSDFASTDIGYDGMSRPYLWGVTWEAVQAYFPSGSGFGSFEDVFHLFEKQDHVRAIFANHAHNDLLEYLLEGGVAGALILGVFLLWFAQRVWVVWFVGQGRSPLAQGASISALAILLHSLVDYPLRTPAIAVVFALCCGLMARRSDSEASHAAASTDVKGKHLYA